MGQRKALCKQKISESSCMRNETVDIDILITSWSGERKIKRPITIASEAALRMRKQN